MFRANFFFKNLNFFELVKWCQIKLGVFSNFCDHSCEFFTEFQFHSICEIQFPRMGTLWLGRNHLNRFELTLKPDKGFLPRWVFPGYLCQKMTTSISMWNLTEFCIYVNCEIKFLKMNTHGRNHLKWLELTLKADEGFLIDESFWSTTEFWIDTSNVKYNF